jgi:hypothetical protein
MENLIYAGIGAVTILAIIYSFKIVRFIRTFLKYYEVLVFEKEDLKALKKEAEAFATAPDIVKFKPISYEHAMDIRGTPTHVCPCGSDIWNLKVSFDDYQIAYYMLDMECVNCGSVATAPTPIDRREDME